MKNKSLRTLAAALALTAMLTACAGNSDYPQAPAYKELPSGEFPIIASYALYHPYMTDTQAEWVKEAGFNVMHKALGTEDTDSLIRLASRHGLYVMARPWGLADGKKAAALARRYADNPSVWGLSVFDEPKASRFRELAALDSVIGAAAPNQFAFINLLPVMDAKDLEAPDYRTYVEEYVKTVNPPFISLDIYPVITDGKGRVTVGDGLYRTMEVIRDVSRESGRPFWSYIMSNSHWRYPEPKEEYIRFAVFSALAYGAQALNYYTYLMPDFDKEKRAYSGAPVDWNGRRTKTWDMVRNVNAEVQNLSKVFLGAEVTDVTQTGEKIPAGTRRTYRLPQPFRGIESFGEGVTVARLLNGDTEYLLLVSRDVTKKQKVRLPRTRPVTRLFGNGKEVEEFVETITLAPGGYALYRLD